MNFEVTFEKHLAHSVDAVWQALTDSNLLAQWLLPNEFVPEIGRPFRLHCEDEGISRDTYHCRVLEMEPPRRMRWSWVLEGSEPLGETFVEFVLEEKNGGTLLRLLHSGDRDASIVERFRSGWPVKLERLAAVVVARRSQS